MKITTRSRTSKTLASIAGLALLLGPLAACGSEDESGDGGTPQPIASITDLSEEGGNTAVALDEATLGALTDLGVTPSPFGTAEITDGSIIFPITGGNVSVFEEGDVPRYVVGQVQHEGSVLSLEAGGTTLEESLALWERGEALAKVCQEWLDGARKRLDEAIGPDAD